jgi:acylphosphatase
MTNTDQLAAYRVRIEGRVQGVSYRAWTQGEAQRHQICGWVRNRADGSVEALIEGTRGALEAMVEALRRGPPAAKVEHLDTQAADPTGAQDFTIEATL